MALPAHLVREPRFGRDALRIAALIGALAALEWLGPRALNPYLIDILLNAGINVILAVSLNLINGLTGQFSIGHAGFLMVGGYAGALATWALVHLGGLAPVGAFAHVLMVAGLGAGGLAAGLVGLLVGLPTLRLRGDYLAVATLGMGEIIRVVFTWIDRDPLRGARGFIAIEPLTNLFWVGAMVALCLFVVQRMLTSRFGRAFTAVRDDEIAASASGVDTTAVKVQAFVIGSFFAGVAGALFAHFNESLYPDTFDFNKSFEVVIMVVIGGTGSLGGSIVGAILLTVLPEALRPLKELTLIDVRMILYALVLIVVMNVRPQGLFRDFSLALLIKKKKETDP